MSAVTIHTSERGYVFIASMDDASLLELIDAYRDEPDAIFTIALDDSSVTHINGQHIVRIDIDQEDQ